MRTGFWFLMGLVCMACSTDGPRRAVERTANRAIGKSPQEAFRDFRDVKCYAEGGEEGCLAIDGRGCRLWYSIDNQTRRITGWKYAGSPDQCWAFWPGG